MGFEDKGIWDPGIKYVQGQGWVPDPTIGRLPHNGSPTRVNAVNSEYYIPFGWYSGTPDGDGAPLAGYGTPQGRGVALGDYWE